MRRNDSEIFEVFDPDVSAWESGPEATGAADCAVLAVRPTLSDR